MVECDDGLNSSENGQTRGRWRNKNRSILEATIEFTQASQTCLEVQGSQKQLTMQWLLLLLASSNFKWEMCL
jgi:hypothetical protein